MYLQIRLTRPRAASLSGLTYLAAMRHSDVQPMKPNMGMTGYADADHGSLETHTYHTLKTIHKSNMYI